MTMKTLDDVSEYHFTDEQIADILASHDAVLPAVWFVSLSCDFHREKILLKNMFFEFATILLDGDNAMLETAFSFKPKATPEVVDSMIRKGLLELCNCNGITRRAIAAKADVKLTQVNDWGNSATKSETKTELYTRIYTAIIKLLTKEP